MGNTIKPKDLLSEDHLNMLKLRYEDLLVIYAILGKANGEGKVWGNTQEVLASITSYSNMDKVYGNFIRSQSLEEIVEYAQYMDEWSEALLPQESPQQQKLRELEETIKSAQKQIEEMKGGAL
jgi:hypothetical protein